MMRDASTYRSERRNLWRSIGAFMPWSAFNLALPLGKWFVGSMQSDRVTMRRPTRSKYMPHNGKREMARRASQAIIGAIIDIPKWPSFNTTQTQGEASE